jgi:hypothetical protein
VTTIDNTKLGTVTSIYMWILWKAKSRIPMPLKLEMILGRGTSSQPQRAFTSHRTFFLIE